MPGQEPVTGQQGAQPREVGEGSIRRHDQDERGRRDRREIQDVAPAVGRARKLGDECLRLGGHCADPGRQEGDAQHQGTQDDRHPDQRGAGVAAARLFEGRNTVGDRLDAGEGGGAAGERAQDQEDRQRLRAVQRLHGRRVGHHAQRPQCKARQADYNRDVHHHDEEVGRDGEDRPGFLDAAQIDEHDEHHQRDGDPDPLRIERRKRGSDLRDTRRDRDGDRQDVIGEQRRAGRLCGQLAQVIARDDVGAAAAGIRVDRLLVRQGQDGEQDDDPDGQRHRKGQPGHARARKDQHQFLGRVRDRGHRIG